MRRRVVYYAAALWYEQGLRFECTGCGDCCRVEGDVWFDKMEARELTNKYTVSASWFDALIAETGHRRVRRGEACIFLDQDKCSVHDARPEQCRAYPFWPRVLETPSAWEAEPCEGISQDAPVADASNAADRWAAWLRRFPYEAAAQIESAEKWARWVADVGLCPWARTALDRGACTYVVGDLDLALDVFVQLPVDPEPILFLVLPHFQKNDFDAFFRSLDDYEDIALGRRVQIAGFHPDWRFHGLEQNDPLHFEKRSPIPIISLVREDALVNAHHATAQIAADNERILQSFTYSDLEHTFRTFSSPSSSSS